MLGFSGGSDDKEFACNAGDLASIPAWRRSPGEGKGCVLLITTVLQCGIIILILQKRKLLLREVEQHAQFAQVSIQQGSEDACVCVCVCVCVVSLCSSSNHLGSMQVCDFKLKTKIVDNCQLVRKLRCFFDPQYHLCLFTTIALDLVLILCSCGHMPSFLL